MRVTKSIAFLITNSFEKLIDPYRRINGKTLPIERCKIGRPCTRLDHGPEAVNAHGDGAGLVTARD
jgi:hypothetical protein